METKLYSKNIAAAINNVLSDEGLSYTFTSKFGISALNFNDDEFETFRYCFDVRDGAYLVYASPELHADPYDAGMMASMAEFLTRANYGLVNGNFEMDMADGQLRYKCYIHCGDQEPTPDLVRESIACPAAMFHRYSKGILDIITGCATARDAIGQCETPAEEILEQLRSLLEQQRDEQ